MTFTLHTQLPKPKTIVQGYWGIERNGEAYFFFGENDSQMERLERAKVDWAAALGIHVSGFVQNGCDKHGRLKYTYQEWWLTYPA